MGWGSGAVDYPYFVAPYDAINERASAEGARVVLSNSDNTGSGASAAQGADVAIVFITADSGEGYIEVEGNRGDRNNLDPWHNGNALVEAVANANENVIVVVHSTGPIILESILSHASVKGIVWAGLPSQESGNALVDVLWGDTNPSGKLVYTIAKQRGDYGTQVVNGNDDYDEGLYIDYRHFDNAGIEPRYEFGFGLCKCTFEAGRWTKTNTGQHTRPLSMATSASMPALLHQALPPAQSSPVVHPVSLKTSLQSPSQSRTQAPSTVLRSLNSTSPTHLLPQRLHHYNFVDSTS
jgi:beta-glucosidase